MPLVTIQVYEYGARNPAATRRLIRTVHLETASTKQLTGKRAEQILKKHFPEFSLKGYVGAVKTEEGWRALSTNGGQGHIWRVAVIRQAE